MRAQAEVLVSRASKWARGTRKRDGVEFVTFLSSRTTADGQPIYYYCRADSQGCTCPSWNYRGSCSHALACQMDREQRAFDDETAAIFEGYTRFEVEAAPALPAPAPVARFSRGYADLFEGNDDVF